jgi:hypothetical protein
VFATLNRWIAAVLFAIAIALVGFAVIFGFFAWINDGPIAGLGVFGTSAAFAAGLALAGVMLRFAAAAHARRAPRRWWIQILAIMAAYFILGLAAWSTSLIDRLSRP